MARLSPRTDLLLITTRWHLGSRIVSGQGPTLFTCSGACIAAADPVASGPQLGRDLPEDGLFVFQRPPLVEGSDDRDGVRKWRSLERKLRGSRSPPRNLSDLLLPWCLANFSLQRGFPLRRLIHFPAMVLFHQLVSRSPLPLPNSMSPFLPAYSENMEDGHRR